MVFKSAMHRVSVGDFEVTVLSDGTYECDGGAFFGVVPKVLWEKRVQADARNMMKVGLNSPADSRRASRRCWWRPGSGRS